MAMGREGCPHRAVGRYRVACPYRAVLAAALTTRPSRRAHPNRRSMNFATEGLSSRLGPSLANPHFVPTPSRWHPPPATAHADSAGEEYASVPEVSEVMEVMEGGEVVKVSEVMVWEHHGMVASPSGGHVWAAAKATHAAHTARAVHAAHHGAAETVHLREVLVRTSLRRFPAPWSAELQPNYCVVRDANGQQLAYIYYSNEPNSSV